MHCSKCILWNRKKNTWKSQPHFQLQLDHDSIYGYITEYIWWPLNATQKQNDVYLLNVVKQKKNTESNFVSNLQIIFDILNKNMQLSYVFCGKKLQQKVEIKERTAQNDKIIVCFTRQRRMWPFGTCSCNPCSFTCTPAGKCCSLIEVKSKICVGVCVY